MLYTDFKPAMEELDVPILYFINLNIIRQISFDQSILSTEPKLVRRGSSRVRSVCNQRSPLPYYQRPHSMAIKEQKPHFVDNAQENTQIDLTGFKSEVIKNILKNKHEEANQINLKSKSNNNKTIDGKIIVPSQFKNPFVRLHSLQSNDGVIGGLNGNYLLVKEFDGEFEQKQSLNNEEQEPIVGRPPQDDQLPFDLQNSEPAEGSEYLFQAAISQFPEEPNQLKKSLSRSQSIPSDFYKD